MLTRRGFVDLGMASLLVAAAPRPARAAVPSRLNDVHSGLNPTPVRGVHRPNSVAQLQGLVRDAGRAGEALSIAGARHAMGGQQFLTDFLLPMLLSPDARPAIEGVSEGIRHRQVQDLYWLADRPRPMMRGWLATDSSARSRRRRKFSPSAGRPWSCAS